MVKRKRVKDVVPVQRPAQQSTKLRAPQSDRSSAFRPFTRDHRAELGHSLGDQSTELSLSSCLAWAHARNLDPAAITDWFLRRTGGECRREHAVAPTHTISGNEENVPISAPQDSHDGIRVKRERAASPILFEPPRKKPRVRQGRQTVALKRNTSHPEANPPAVILKPVRHTRAHDGNLHPACPTCNPSTWLSAPGNCSPLRTAFDRVPTVDVSLPSSSERPSPFRLVRRSGFKSALRSSSPRVPAIGSSRRVRFSQELHDEALIAYTQQKTSSQRKNIAYIDTNQGGTTLPPRQKRKYALLSQAENSTLVPAETPVLEDSAVLSLSSGRSALCDSSLDVLPSLGASCTFGNSTSCSEAAPLGSADTAWRRSAVLSSTKATVTTTHENRKYSDDTGQDTPSKKSKLSSTSSQGPDVTPVPPVFIPLAHHPARDSFPPPRTPSPRAGTTPHSGSFFSPSFFSPCPSSLSGEEVEALLVSSPPTSPSVIPRSSSPHEIMCPSPKHPLISSMISYPHPKTPGGDAHVVGAIASSPSSHSPPRISTSPFPLLVISPPADIPPRTRTPPDSGPEPGSKPCTPRPSKPSRPTAMGVISPELWEDREQGPARVVELPFPPRACTPPGGSGGGSKPCTPRPARPHRPNVDHYDLNTSQIELGITRTAIRQEEEEEWVDIRRMLAQEEEEDDVAALCDAGRAPLRPQFLPSSAFVPAPEGPPTGYIMGPTGRAECGTDVPTHPDNIAAVLRYTDTHRVGALNDLHALESSSPPADIPPRMRTPPGGNPPGSRQGTPRPARPPRPSVLDICAEISDSGGQMTPPGDCESSNELPFPPRSRTPPGSPVGGSRHSTPKPTKPPQPVGGGVLVPQGVLRHSGIQGLREESDVVVKREEISVTNLSQPGIVLVMEDDEDDEPLAVVLAKRGRTTVKVESDSAVSTGKQAKKPRKKNVGATVGGEKGRPAVTVVKLEDDVAQGVSQAPAPKSKKVKKPKATKQAKKEAADEAKPGREFAATTPKCQDGPSKMKKPRKKREPKGPSTNDTIPTTSGQDGSAVTKSGKPRKKPLPMRKAAEATIPSTTTATTIQVRVSLSRSSSLKGAKHPPRTFTYLPEHIDALGTVVWDTQGFERMELSALPWIAGVAQHWYDTDGDPSGGHSQQLIDSPYDLSLPCHFLMDEEDVHVRLYAGGPLPASFLDALGRAVSIRRDGEGSNTGVDSLLGEADDAGKNCK